MFVVLESILTAPQLRQLQSVLSPEKFSSGAATAHGDARRVKNNRQLATSHPEWSACAALVLEAVNACSSLKLYAMPVRMTPPIFNLHDEGMYYGPHTDATLMNAGGSPMRADYSMTLFLTPPDGYDGGELVLISTENVEMAAKLAAGSAVLYPSNATHEVRPVTKGKRLAAVMWIQSALPLEQQRTAIQDLDQVRRFLDEGNLEVAKDRLRQVRGNLVRLFARP